MGGMPSTVFVLLHIAVLAVAQKLQFVQPDFNAVRGAGLPYFTVGQSVDIRWNTSFSSTNLEVFQRREDGTFVSQILAEGYADYMTNYTWQATPLRKTRLGSPFHFMLRNQLDAGCDGCTLNSASFNVKRKSATSSSSTLTTSSSTSSASPTSKTSRTGATAAAASTTTSPSSSPTKSSKSGSKLGVPLGVGLGVGIPVLLALLGFLAFCLRRRQKTQQRESLPRGRQPEDSISDSSRREMRESGALGPYSQSPMPIRTSQAGMSDTSGWSHTSWIEPFEFERGGSRGSDAMSQLRNSISSLPSARENQYSSWRSDMSYAPTESSLREIPEEPQPVHGRHPENWPLP